MYLLSRSIHFLKAQKAIVAVFLLCFSYWIYLICTSEIALSADAIGYEVLAQMIHEKGWAEFFRTGPHREPLYPLTISVSMGIADMFSVSYQLVQTIIQVAILFVTQILIFTLLTKLKISRGIKLVTILYFGFSPAIVNSAFSLFSEIMAYPAVLAIIFGGYYSWKAVHGGKLSKVVLWGVFTALSFACAAFVKGIFQYIFLFFLIPYVYVAIGSLIKRKKRMLCYTAAYIMTTLIVLGSLVVSYRFMNKVHSGHFDFTNRYDVLLFANAAVRVGEHDTELFMARILSVPGDGVCRSFLSKEACWKANFLYGDAIWPKLLERLLEETPQKDINAKTISLAFEKMSENPLQYLVLTFIESLRMGFWESTKIGFVRYPDGLTKLFNFSLFKNGIRLGISLLTYISLLFCALRLYRNRKKFRAFDSDENNAVQIGFFTFLIIIPFTGLYSMFSILTRFAFPIVPLYFLCIAYFLQNASDRICRARRQM